MRIGLQTSRLEYGYGVKIWQEAMKRVETLNADLIIFPGRNLNTPHGFDFQYNRIFSLMNRENLDALILVSTLVSNYVDRNVFLDFCSGFKDLPIVSIGLQIPNVPSIIIDNRSGVREVVRHMIKVHGARNLAFIRGPASNWEAQERFGAYREELREQSIPFNEDLVAQGDFTSNCVEAALDSLLQKNRNIPDVFIFSNDEMAIKGLQILQEKGINIPATTAITGFDDILEASTQMVPLTTIIQSQEEMAWKAVKMVSDMINGIPVQELTVLPTKAVIRSSCGCGIRCIEELGMLEHDISKRIQSGNKKPEEYVLSSLIENGFESILTISRKTVLIDFSADLLEICKKDTDPVSGREREKLFLRKFIQNIDKDRMNGSDTEEWKYLFPLLLDAIQHLHRESIDHDIFNHITRSCLIMISELTRMQQNSLDIRKNETQLILREIHYALSSIIHIEDLSQVLREQLPRVGINTFMISRFETEWVHQYGKVWDIPKEMYFITGLVNGHTPLHFEKGNYKYPSNRLLPQKNMWESKGKNLAVFPLFFRETHYGTIIMEMTHNDGSVFESLATQISGILKTIILFTLKEKAEEKLRQAMMELESFNKQLSDLSITDELTGLYNRRGFIQLASQQLYLTKQMKKKSLLIFGDIDGLKGINDRYGHEEGDFAIKAIAGILKKVFREMDIISRFGGDEFTILTPNSNKDIIPVFEKRIGNLISEANTRNGKPYSLGISIGCTECLEDYQRPLEDLIRDADILLYEKKKSKRDKA